MDAPGTLLAGRYELRSLAGRGGMATVWRGVLKGAAQFETEVAIGAWEPVAGMIAKQEDAARGVALDEFVWPLIGDFGR